MNRKRKLVYKIKQKNLKIIDGWPFVYWVGEKVLSVFEKREQIKDFAEPKFGINTGDNDRFLRFYWEVAEGDVGQTKKWTPYSKGGDFCRWFGNLDSVVNFDEQKIRKYSGSAIRNKAYYYREGLTFTLVSSKGFSARYLPSGFIFDGGGPCIFSGRSSKSNFLFLGILNSRFSSYCLGLLNPTVNFQIGDVGRVPLRERDFETGQKAANYAEGCTRIKRSLLQFYINDREFKQTAIEFGKEQSSSSKLLESYKAHLDHKEAKLVKLHTHKGLIDKESFALYEIYGDDLIHILEEQGIPPAWYPVLDGYDNVPDNMLQEAREFLSGGREQMLKDFKIQGFIPEKPSLPLDKLKKRFKKLYLGEEKPRVNQATEDYIEDIAIDLGINSVSVLALRKEMDLVNPSDYKHEAENFLAYHLIEELKEDQDGIIPITPIPGHQTALEHLRKRLEMVFGEDRAYDIEQEMREPLGKPFEKWLEKDFFRKHIKQYKKRPIVWQIESPKATFKVLLYYHQLTADTLNKLKTIYLWKLRYGLSYRLEELRRQTKDPAAQLPKTFYQQLEALEEELEDLKEFEGRLDTVMQSGYDPDIDDGVRANIAPLQLAGVLAAPVLAESDAKKAISDLKEWKKS